MKSILGNPVVKKTMRVATVFTGAAVGLAAYAPVAKANSAVPWPYTTWVKTSSSVSYLKVCGWKDVGGGSWYCTGVEHNPYYPNSVHSNYFGGNWKDGKMVVTTYSDGEQRSTIHSCNTNGAYHGVFRTGGVSLSTGFHHAIGMGNSNEC